MKTQGTVHLVALLTLLASATLGSADEGKRDLAFGEKLKLEDTKTLPVARLFADLEEHEDRYVRVSGKVDAVCERRGCWLSMSDKDSELFVKFTCPIDGSLIPESAVGHEVIVEGTLTVKEISEEMARHLEEEKGSTPEEVAAIVGPQKQVSLASPAALVRAMEVRVE